MIWNWRCRRFSRLLNEREDRSLTANEAAFIESHREACACCRRLEQQSFISLDLLRLASIDVEAAPGFDHRVIRRAKNQATVDTVRYWSPALVGAAVAGIAALAAIQIVTRSNHLPQVKVPGAESRKVSPSSEPLLRLERDRRPQ
jgi:hypothetical protein